MADAYRIVGPDDIDGPERIPGKDLEEAEAEKLWREVRKSAEQSVGRFEMMCLGLAELWDRRGVNRLGLKWPVSAIRSGIWVGSDSRLYQLIQYGRRKWHLQHREGGNYTDGINADRIGERAMRALLPLTTAKASKTLARACDIATKESHDHYDEEGWKNYKADEAIEVRPRHVNAALAEVEPVRPVPGPTLTQVTTAITRAYKLATAARAPEAVILHLNRAMEAMP